MPRYRLQVGQELDYDAHDVSKYIASGKIAFEQSSSTRDMVVGQAGDGWRLIEENFVGAGHTAGDAANQTPRSVIEFTLFPDGRIDADPNVRLETNLHAYFPVLPAAADADWAKTGWSSSPDVFGEVVRYRLAAPATQPAAEGQLTLSATDDGPEEHIYQWTPTTTLHFDLRRGILAAGEMHCDEPQHKQAEDEHFQLTSSTLHPQPWIDGYAAQAKAMSSATQQYEKAMGDAATAGDTTPARMQAALAILQQAQPRVTDPALSARRAGDCRRRCASESPRPAVPAAAATRGRQREQANRWRLARGAAGADDLPVRARGVVRPRVLTRISRSAGRGWFRHRRTSDRAGA